MLRHVQLPSRVAEAAPFWLPGQTALIHWALGGEYRSPGGRTDQTVNVQTRGRSAMDLGQKVEIVAQASRGRSQSLSKRRLDGLGEGLRVGLRGKPYSRFGRTTRYVKGG